MLLSSVFVCTPDTWQRRSTVLGQVRVAYVQWYQFIHPPGNRKSCILLLFARRIKFLSSWWVKGLSSCPRVTGIISIFLSVWWLWLVAHGNQTSSIQLIIPGAIRKYSQYRSVFWEVCSFILWGLILQSCPPGGLTACSGLGSSQKQKVLEVLTSWV